MWLALTALALALAYYMWSAYALVTCAPHLPPEWLGSISSESCGDLLEPYALLTMALAALAVFTAPPLVIAVCISSIQSVAALFRSHKDPS
jgi:hypothetical protein